MFNINHMATGYFKMMLPVKVTLEKRKLLLKHNLFQLQLHNLHKLHKFYYQISFSKLPHSVCS